MPRGIAANITDATFTAAPRYLREGVLALLPASGPVTLYPARDAWIEGEPREVREVTVEQAARLLVHIPPPYYLSEDAAKAGGFLVPVPHDGPASMDAPDAPAVNQSEAAPVASEPTEV